MKGLLVSLFLVPSLAFSFPTAPNPAVTFPTYCQKGEKDFKMVKYGDVAICNRNVTIATKKKVYSLYSIPVNERVDYTIDHLVPLSLGGSNKITNLWPQHKSITSAPLEYKVFNDLESGVITYKEAVNIVLKYKIP